MSQSSEDIRKGRETRVLRAEDPTAVARLHSGEAVLSAPFDHAVDFVNELPVPLRRQAVPVRLVGIEA